MWKFWHDKVSICACASLVTPRSHSFVVFICWPNFSPCTSLFGLGTVTFGMDCICESSIHHFPWKCWIILAKIAGCFQNILTLKKMRQKNAIGSANKVKNTLKQEFYHFYFHLTHILEISRFEVPISRFFWAFFRSLQICMFWRLAGLVLFLVVRIDWNVEFVSVRFAPWLWSCYINPGRRGHFLQFFERRFVYMAHHHSV